MRVVLDVTLAYVYLSLFLFRVENSQIVSLGDLESVDAYLVATFLAVNLRGMIR